MPVAKQYGNRHLFLYTHCNNTLHPADCADDADFNFPLSGNSPPHRNLTDLVEFCFFLSVSSVPLWELRTHGMCPRSRPCGDTLRECKRCR